MLEESVRLLDETQQYDAEEMRGLRWHFTLAREEFEIPPLDEQRRIADLLWAADNVCNELTEVHSAFQNPRTITRR